MDSTKTVASRRKIILDQWFTDLMFDDNWKKFINNKGKLKVAPSLRALGEIETGRPDAMWNDSYFKTGHWSSKSRSDFEQWVSEHLAKHTDCDLFGSQHNEDLNLPLWLDNEDLSDGVRELIRDLAEERKHNKATIKELARRINQKDLKIIDLEKLHHNAEDRYLAVEKHCMGSVRTLRYNAGMDIDLSCGDLLGNRE